MPNLKAIKKARTLADLQDLNVGPVTADLGHRGGGVGFRGSDVAAYVGVEESDLPRFYGAYCNYLGGGVRGSINPSGYNKDVPAAKAAVLDALAAAAVRAYKSAEDEDGLNEEADADGETNWDALATAASRRAGVKSAY